MPPRRTKANLARIAAEVEADTATAEAPKAAPAPTAAPATTVRKPSTDTYQLGEPTFTEKNGLFNWTAEVTLGDKGIAKVTWNASKKIATVAAVGKAAADTTALNAFEATAKRLLPGRDSITDLVIVLGVTSSPAISNVNKLLLTKDVVGAETIIRDPGLLAPKKK